MVDEHCNGSGKELVSGEHPGIKLICPDFFTESATFHDMIPVTPPARLENPSLIGESGNEED